MYLDSRILYLYVETPLHAGTGSVLGAVDLPIQRERYTNYPIIQASGLKGVLRELVEGDPQELEKNLKKEAVFGPEPIKIPQSTFAGAFGISDARVLLFPVRSLKGVFAWTTCIDILRRWRRESQDILDDLPELPRNDPGTTPEGVSKCFSLSGVALEDQHVILEEFDFTKADDPMDSKNELLLPKLSKYLAEFTLPCSLDIYWKEQLQQKLVILNDDDFRDLITHTTQVLTRIRLDPGSKTVVQGALWTEENLPVDTLLYAPARAARLRTPDEKTPMDWKLLDARSQAQKVLEWICKFAPERAQVGGDETVGRGIVRLRWQGKEKRSLPCFTPELIPIIEEVKS